MRPARRLVLLSDLCNIYMHVSSQDFLFGIYIFIVPFQNISTNLTSIKYLNYHVNICYKDTVKDYTNNKYLSRKNNLYLFDK